MHRLLCWLLAVSIVLMPWRAGYAEAGDMLSTAETLSSPAQRLPAQEMWEPSATHTAHDHSTPSTPSHHDGHAHCCVLGQCCNVSTAIVDAIDFAKGLPPEFVVSALVKIDLGISTPPPKVKPNFI